MLFHWDSSDIFHITKHKQSSKITCKSWLLAQWSIISDCQSVFCFLSVCPNFRTIFFVFFIFLCFIFIKADFKVSFHSSCNEFSAPCFYREDFDQEEKAHFGELCSGENGKGREWFAKYVSAQVSAEKIKRSLVIPIIVYKHQPNNQWWY